MRTEIEFLRQGKRVRLAGFSPTLTLLDHLRLTERACGTKEGCAEGDCGACTVVLRRREGGRMVYRPVNACILLAGQAHASEVITVEDLAAGRRLHPVQQAMVEKHASQCGFCTPGFVMALFALYHAGGTRPPRRADVNDFIAGNLCRCTGYRPIVNAALAACAQGPDDAFTRGEVETAAALADLDDDADIMAGDSECFFAAPRSIDALAALFLAHPDAVIVAGATDVGLWVTKQMRDLRKIIWLGRVRGLDTIADDAHAVTFGAMVPHAAARPVLAAIDPDLGELMRRFAGEQIRQIGTIGGNIANGSPIGDTPPALIALGASLVLQRGGETRSLMLEDFFLAYRRQDRRPGEFVRAVQVPKLAPDDHFRCYKVSKRLDQDISAVMGAFRLTVRGSIVASARVAFGGMAGVPQRARATETALAGAALDDPDTWRDALAALGEDFAPISDQRASAGYRLAVARGLLRKALMEVGGMPSARTRITGARENADELAS